MLTQTDPATPSGTTRNAPVVSRTRPASILARPHSPGRTPAHAFPRAPAPARGFTLVELLIVIGIIAVLASLLLTVRSRASDQAAKAQCLNNLRQLGLAMTMYAQDNDQAFPYGSPLDNSPPGDAKADWIHWQVPVNRQEEEINNSALARYVKARGSVYQSLMLCPSDDPDNHKAGNYRYSYSMNYMMSSDRGKIYNHGATPRVTAINRPSDKILLAEENERTINDGYWVPGNYTDTDGPRASWVVAWDYLSVRHDTRKSEFTQPVQGTLPMQTRRGNVAFVDGHADYVSRKFAHSPQNTVVRDEGTGQVPPDPSKVQ
jgi:prepilin-type N-terminal cleavage/methylation domain-containing protein/prepilin-type processing-associated H-X9-DG protein